jgi:hypothetical protein
VLQSLRGKPLWPHIKIWLTISKRNFSSVCFDDIRALPQRGGLFIVAPRRELTRQKKSLRKSVSVRSSPLAPCWVEV